MSSFAEVIIAFAGILYITVTIWGEVKEYQARKHWKARFIENAKKEAQTDKTREYILRTWFDTTMITEEPDSTPSGNRQK